MMAPEHYEAAEAATARHSSAVAGASSHGADEPEAREPLRWPHTSRRHQERLQQPLPLVTDSSESEQLEIEGEDVRRVEGGRREYDQQVAAEESPPSDADPSSAPASNLAVHEQPAEDAPPAATPISEAEFTLRASKMFVVGAAGPTDSMIVPRATIIQKEDVGVAMKIVRSYIKQHGIKALSQSYGNFDQVVGQGWLLGDAAGIPLMDRADAHKVGLRARDVAVALAREQLNVRKAASRAISKLAADDPVRKQLKEQAADAEAAPMKCFHTQGEKRSQISIFDP